MDKNITPTLTRSEHITFWCACFRSFLLICTCTCMHSLEGVSIVSTAFSGPTVVVLMHLYRLDDMR
jgi:hypothetical protein